MVQGPGVSLARLLCHALAGGFLDRQGLCEASLWFQAPGHTSLSCPGARRTQTMPVPGSFQPPGTPTPILPRLDAKPCLLIAVSTKYPG